MTTKKIGGSDCLGRCCFNTKDANRNNARTQFILRSFVGREMSVDYQPQANGEYLTDLHTEEGKGRIPKQTFYGWYVFEADVVFSGGGGVASDATPENQWHSNVIPPDLQEASDELLQFYENIASNSCWLRRVDPTSTLLPSVEEFLEKTLDQD